MKALLLATACAAFGEPAIAQATLGLIEFDPANQDGYVLFAPLPSLHTYLIDKCGREVHQWNSVYRPGDAVYFLENGTLLRTGNTNNPAFNSGGRGGIIQVLDWNSNVLWEVSLSNAQHCLHHDVRALPNGNVLAIMWEKHDATEAIAAGRNPALLGTEIWSEAVLELQPIGVDSAAVVWEWHLWDHLVQEFDPLLPNYGVVQDHPGLLDLNFIGGPPTQADWIHMNAVDYDIALDQIMLSSHNLNEIWVIDHSTTTVEAAGHTGGSSGRGGDLLYRWGNPQVYDRGSPSEQLFFGQHNAQWIAPGLPDQGNILVFNNGLGRPLGAHSTVDIIEPPVDVDGNYELLPGQPYGPVAPFSSWSDTPPEDFYSSNISGAQQLPSGGFVVCDGATGEFFELDPGGDIVWRYINPVSGSGPLTQGDPPMNNTVFRCAFLDPSYPGLVGQSLIPGDEIELDPIVPSLCLTVGAQEPSISAIRVSPNPVSDALYITAAGTATVEFSLLDATGRGLRQVTIKGAGDVDVHDLATGMYTLRAAAPTTWAERIVIAH